MNRFGLHLTDSYERAADIGYTYFSHIKTVMHMNKSEALSKIQIALTGDSHVM